MYVYTHMYMQPHGLASLEMLATKGSGYTLVKVEGCVFGYPRTGSLDGELTGQGALCRSICMLMGRPLVHAD
jgi:hypothetical protein